MTPEKLAYYKRYRKTPKAKASTYRYRKSSAGLAARRRYRTSLKGRAAGRREDFKAKYGVSWAQREVMIKAQKGLCAICQKVPNKWHTDHDHKFSKSVRGFLCRGCNVGLGNFKDSIDLLARAIVYLQRSRK